MTTSNALKTIVFALLFCLPVTLFAQGVLDPTAPAPPPQPTEYTQFNFWVGTWDVFKYDTETLVGDSRIESILDGKGVRETYSSTTAANYRGTSLNQFNQQNGQWEQFWIDNGGLTLHLVGGLKEGSMVLEGKTKNQKGEEIDNRITWSPGADGTVRQMWDQSKDGGKTWNRAFDGHYRKKSDG